MAFAACTSPSNISVVFTAPDQLRIRWEGAASTYKLAYKREEDTPWSTVTQSGPGSSGSSGLSTDDTGGVIIPTGPNLTADFILTGLAAGVYDFRVINLCGDGTDFFRKAKGLVEVPKGKINNLRFSEDPGSGYQLNIEWDAPTINTGEPLTVSWCEINKFGQKLDCDAAELPSDSLSYSIINPDGKLMKVFVSQKVNNWQNVVSNVLYIEACPCDNGYVFQPFALESESDI